MLRLQTHADIESQTQTKANEVNKDVSILIARGI